MPNFSAHLGIAKDAASRLKHPIVDQYLGAFLLGAVAPDIRIITRGRRDDTHFVHLDFKRKGESLECLFQLHPHLARAGSLTEPTRAFIVGYASHLFADELWILDLYRPFFDNPAVYHDRLQGDLMDRALQLELDRKEQQALGGLATLHPFLADAEEDIEVGFIPQDTICQWRQWVEGELDRDFTWERLRFMSRRIISQSKTPSEAHLEQMVEEFLTSLPQSLENIYHRVPVEKVTAFRQESLDDLLRFAREYLK